MKFTTFNSIIGVMEDMGQIRDGLIKIGFDMESNIINSINNNIDSMLKTLNEDFDLKKDDCGYTTIDWWYENRNSKNLNLKTITYKDTKYIINNEKDLYNYITKIETKGE